MQTRNNSLIKFTENISHTRNDYWHSSVSSCKTAFPKFLRHAYHTFNAIYCDVLNTHTNN
jgi:hypothetical protein